MTAAVNININVDSLLKAAADAAAYEIPMANIPNFIEYQITDSDNGKVTQTGNTASIEELIQINENSANIEFTLMAQPGTNNGGHTMHWQATPITQSDTAADLTFTGFSNNNQTAAFSAVDASQNHSEDQVMMYITIEGCNINCDVSWDPRVIVIGDTNN
jgi:hypothetical protein